MKMRHKIALTTALGAALVGGVATPALAGYTSGFNDGYESVGVVENGVYHGLPPGRTTVGYLGLSDIDTIVLGANQCGMYAVDYGPWRTMYSKSIGISASATVVHMKGYRC